MKLYTKTGDDGSTGLPGGARISKAAELIGCYGDIDELNAALGLAAVDAPSPISAALATVQNSLFTLGASLAIPPAGLATPPSITNQDILNLEQQIDGADAQLPPLHQFILPGGVLTAARLHLARTICRRAERGAVHLSTSHPIPPLVPIYLNRLSDWLFIHARLANHLAGKAETPWKK